MLHFPKKKEYTCFTACQKKYTREQEPMFCLFVCFFFALFTPALRGGRETRDTCYARVTSSAGYDASANSSFAQPNPPPPPATAGHFPALSVLGVGHLQILCCPGAGHLPNLGPTRTFDTHTVSYQKITTQRILLELQADWLICQGQERIGEVCVGMISILRMHFFIAYHARIT